MCQQHAGNLVVTYARDTCRRCCLSDAKYVTVSQIVSEIEHDRLCMLILMSTGFNCR